MNASIEANADQAEFWNGAAGRGWVEAQRVLDRMLLPFEELLVRKISRVGPRSVLDIGCGTGSTTIAAARSLGEGGRCVGIDISAPMIALARERASAEGVSAEFVCADAQVHAFDSSGFDLLVSRFGIMFFDDPAAAFANLRRAARREASLYFLAWRSPEENDFMTAAEHAVKDYLPEMEPRLPGAPGQFAFADRDRVAALLTTGGWHQVSIEAIDVSCSTSREDLAEYVTWVGPVGRALQAVDESMRQSVLDRAIAAFKPWIHGDMLRFEAACWGIRAHA